MTSRITNIIHLFESGIIHFSLLQPVVERKEGIIVEYHFRHILYTAWTGSSVILRTEHKTV